MTRLLLRPFRKSIGAQIFAGYAITTAFALVVAAISLYSVVAVNSRLTEIAETDQVLGTNVNRIALALEQQNDSIRSYLVAQDPDQRDLAQFHQAGDDLRRAGANLRELLPDDQAQGLLDEIERRHRRFEAIAQSEVSLQQQGLRRSANFLWRMSGKESKDDLERAVRALADWHETQTRQDIDESANQSLLVLFVSIGLVAAGGLGAFLLGRRMTDRITDRLEVLALQAESIRNGDLAARIPPLGHDELALLGDGLNRMAADLEESHRRLARALDATQAREDELRVLNAVAATVSRSLDLEAILQASLEQVCAHLRIETADIMLLDEATGDLVLGACRGVSTDIRRDLARLRPDELLPSLVAATGEPIVVDDLATDARAHYSPAVQEGYRALASVPMSTKDRPVGVLNVVTRQVRRFTPAEVTLLTAIGHQIALAVENARLYRQARELGVAEERNRMAREIHDTLAQGLTAITLQLEWADAVLDRDVEQARTGVARALETARGNLEEARRSVMDLRAAPLEGLSLAEALKRLVDGFARDQEVEASFVADRMTDRFSARVEAGLYRIAQEALANVAKHAVADRLTLELSHEAGRVRLVVEDDGEGFDPCAPRPGSLAGGFGLVGMRERAALLQGTCDVESAPGRGTRLVVDVPDGEQARRRRGDPGRRLSGAGMAGGGGGASA